MADQMDMAQERQQEILERQIKSATARKVGASAFNCEVCDEPIPEQRRLAVAGVSYCVTCQEINELKSKLYKGAI
ncbi:TraR/DksA family transcriptional regulator [Hafnia alvei]|uniref:TraR/DksA family transcriptional regulator n=1 Tax=Hafnia alvei TaxID=569 RepID=UPI001034AACA|nr:TraR/DksA family transcriptional regulator [Hafnia alvei]TBM18747.1 TraR/DksA family transcriptional regulator [Hafnia alvei]